jgi:regulatory protein
LYALKLLGYRSRSEKELRERLGRKGFQEAIIDRALLRLKEAGFIDDTALAADLKRHAFDRKLLGYEGAKSFMLKRGLSRSTVESAVSYDEEAEVEKAVKFLDKKMSSMGNYPAKERKKKLWNFLARRGYSSAVIRRAMKDFYFEEEV